MGFFPSKVSQLAVVTNDYVLVTHPSHTFLAASTHGCGASIPGYDSAGWLPFSLEIDEPSWGFSPRHLLVASGSLEGGAYYLPSKAGLRHRSRHTFSLPPPQPLP